MLPPCGNVPNFGEFAAGGVLRGGPPGEGGRLGRAGCSETNSIYHVEAGSIQRIAIVMGPGFYDPHLTPESIAENYAKVESIEGFSEPVPFEPDT
jgi:hypothetical protein